MSNGLCVNPLKGHNSSQNQRSLRDVVFQINNTEDLNNYITSCSLKTGQRPAEARYQLHPVRVLHCALLSDHEHVDTDGMQSLGPSQQVLPVDPRSQLEPSSQSEPPGGLRQSSLADLPYAPSSPQNQGPAPEFATLSNPSEQTYHESPHPPNFSPAGGGSILQQPPHPHLSSSMHSQPPPPLVASNSDPTHPDVPALRPVFGVSLDDLLQRDGSAIPLVVYQCLQAVELFGLDVEGIYRLSGSAPHVSKLRAIFDNGLWFLPLEPPGS